MTDETQKTGESLDKSPKPGTFKKGYDPRRNLRGIPKDWVMLRKTIREIAAELVKFKDDNGEGDVTRLYIMLRAMMTSRNPKDREMVLKMLGSGSLTDHLDLTSGGLPVTLKVVYEDKKTNNA